MTPLRYPWEKYYSHTLLRGCWCSLLNLLKCRVWLYVIHTVCYASCDKLTFHIFRGFQHQDSIYVYIFKLKKHLSWFHVKLLERRIVCKVISVQTGARCWMNKTENVLFSYQNYKIWMTKMYKWALFQNRYLQTCKQTTKNFEAVFLVFVEQYGWAYCFSLTYFDAL